MAVVSNGGGTRAARAKMALDGDEVDDDNDRIALHSAVPLGQYGLSTFYTQAS